MPISGDCVKFGDCVTLGNDVKLDDMIYYNGEPQPAVATRQNKGGRTMMTPADMRDAGSILTFGQWADPLFHGTADSELELALRALELVIPFLESAGYCPATSKALTDILNRATLQRDRRAFLAMQDERKKL